VIDTATRLEAILGRQVWDIDYAPALQALQAERILVTGARGSIGAAVVDAFDDWEIDALATDREDMDVTDLLETRFVTDQYRPTVILHLAAAKHAPWSEQNPGSAAQTNVEGTANVLRAAGVVGARVVTASTCKACNPETVYGATKLIAERMTLEAGGSVARFFNTVETCGNVFRLWEELPEDDPLPVTPCGRYFLALSEAVALMIYTATQPAGRYVVHPGRRPRVMPSVAAAAWPGRPIKFISARRGDRLTEPLCAADEWMEPVNEWLWQVKSRHDRVSA